MKSGYDLFAVFSFEVLEMCSFIFFDNEIWPNLQISFTPRDILKSAVFYSSI